MYRLQLLGFNGVRLPFTFQGIFNAPPKVITYRCSTVRGALLLLHFFWCMLQLRFGIRAGVWVLGMMDNPALLGLDRFLAH